MQAERDAPDAATMLELHAGRSAAIASRSAHLAWVIETAATGDKRVADLWARMTNNLRFGVSTAAETLLQKPGVRADLTRQDAEDVLLIAMHWSTYRTLTGLGELRPEAIERWIRRYYQRMLQP